MKKSHIITSIVAVVSLVFMSFLGFKVLNTPENNNNIIESQRVFVKSGTFTSEVDELLINKGIDYVKNYYVSLSNNAYPEVDIQKTKLNYKCEYTKPAKDDEYLYLNLTCIGEALDSSGDRADATLTNFSENPTRLKYAMISDEFVVSEMVQPISPIVFNESLPQEYIEMLEK